MVSPSEYLPHLFRLGGSLFDDSGRMCLVTPSAATALENYIDSYNYSDKTVYQWWKGALEGFANGSAAMTVVFMNYASDIVNSQNASIAGKIGYATVPGNKPLLGGGVVGITRRLCNGLSGKVTKHLFPGRHKTLRGIWLMYL